jgi:SAM-dependent methyltransferase
MFSMVGKRTAASVNSSAPRGALIVRYDKVMPEHANRSFARDLALATLPVVLVLVSTIAWTFPYATDDPVRREDAIAEYYDRFFDPTEQATVIKDTAEAREGRAARDRLDIRGETRRFVARYHLEHARVLDVGSGEGYLQDVVSDYTGFDIAKSAQPYYHKPFVLGTATAMPFPEASFDVVWSIWVLEHVPNPEAALREIRRVVKPGGYIYLRPAWDVVHWASRGLDARPYTELGWRDRAERVTIPLRRSTVTWTVAHVPMRLIRSMSPQPTTLHYRRLTPNFTEYWQADSGAVNDLDVLEVAHWFESRGDTCLDCSPGWRRYVQWQTPLEIRRGR